MTNTFPPPEYIQTESAVAGITVYMPRPPQEEHKEVVEFRCPQCDGTIAYSAEDGGLTCSFCAYHEAPEQDVVGTDAETYEFTVETMHRATHGWGAERKELVCNSCNAHVTLATDMLSHSCPFCASNQVVQARAPQDVLRPRFLAPLTVTPDDCRRETAVWFQNNWMLPKELHQLARTAEYTPLYIPFWTFDADIHANWKAEVGKTKKVRGKYKNVWKWENGRVNARTNDLLVQGSEKIHTKLLRQIGKFDLQKLVTYDATYLAGVQAQAYDINLEEAWQLGRRRMRERAKKMSQNQASTKRIRNFQMNLAFEDESWRYILLPVYLATYRYGNESYQVLINGQTGKLAGQRPADWRKIWTVIAAIMAPIIIFGILTQVIPNIANLTPLSMLFLLGGLIASGYIFNEAQKIDAL